MKISEATKKEQVLGTDSVPVGAANSNQAYRLEMSQINKFVHSNPASTTGDYFELVDVNGNPVKVTKASAASMIAEVIRTTPDLQAKVTFGAVDAAGLSSVVAGQSAMTDKVKTRLSILVAHTHLLSYGQEALIGRDGMWAQRTRLSMVTCLRGVRPSLIA